MMDDDNNAPTFTMSRQVRAARKAMGESRWLELNQEWEEVIPAAVVKSRNEAAWTRALEIAARHGVRDQ